MTYKNIRHANGICKTFLPVALLGVIASTSAMAYELIDLGANVEPSAINNLGVVVGNGTISVPPPVENQQPVAVASANMTSVKTRQLVTFDSSASIDPDGKIVGYSWDFMDGSFSNEANPAHTFTETGTYLVTLSVTDDQGATASDSISITVRKGKRK